MIKNFNSLPMLKSSENCDKYSKSVSYKTLVGGTTTIGRGIKQTRRLSKGSADKPLSAVGTLTSLLCNSSKVVEKLLRHIITRRTLVRRGYLPEQGTHANKESLFASVTWLMRLPRRIQRMLLAKTMSGALWRKSHKAPLPLFFLNRIKFALLFKIFLLS